MQLARAPHARGALSSRNSTFAAQTTFKVKNVAVVTMRKKGIHPEWYEESKVVCNGEEVLVTSGTQPDYNVDIWSGNHPYFQGITTSVVTDEGRVNRFKRRFEGLDSLSAVETTSSAMAKENKGKK